MPTTGAFRCEPPSDPKKGAPPKEKTPPSDATVQYAGTVSAGLELAVSVAGAGVARFVAVDVAPAAVVVAAPSAEAATTDSPRTVAAATATSVPRREMGVPRAGRELARILMSSKVGNGPTSPLKSRQACHRVAHSLVVDGLQVNDHGEA